MGVKVFFFTFFNFFSEIDTWKYFFFFSAQMMMISSLDHDDLLEHHKTTANLLRKRFINSNLSTILCMSPLDFFSCYINIDGMAAEHPRKYSRRTKYY